MVFYRARRLAGTHGGWSVGRVEESREGREFKSCTMIITKPNAFVADVHDRMPAILAERDFEPWLRGQAGVELLGPAPDDLLQRWPVSQRVNSSKAPVDDPTLIDRIDPEAAWQSARPRKRVARSRTCYPTRRSIIFDRRCMFRLNAMMI